jgi:hypothetical protein
MSVNNGTIHELNVHKELLQNKPRDDPTARVEAWHLIDDWLNNHQPAFEMAFKETSQHWYKPTNDPIATLVYNL